MADPKWYSGWCHESLHQLIQKNGELKSEFRISDWPRFDYDLEAGTLTFSDGGTVKVVAEIQIAGSTSVNAGDWLWAWANSHWPSPLVTDAALARSFGEEHGICELTHENVEDDNLNDLGWALTSITVRLGNALGAYRPPRDEGGGLYLIYKSIAWAS